MKTGKANYGCSGVYSASNLNEYQKEKRMFLRSRALLARKADNLTTICELTI
jgi:hypothetical protein